MSIARIYLKKGCQEVPQGEEAGWKGVINGAPQRSDLVYPAVKQDLIRVSQIGRASHSEIALATAQDEMRYVDRGAEFNRQSYLSLTGSRWCP